MLQRQSSMNIFLRELLNRRKAQIWWVVAVAVFMLLSITKFDALETNAAASEALLKQFPATMQAIFGMSGLNLTTVSGYYGVLFIYILIMFSIHAGMLGSSLLANEEQDRTSEFLFVKPRSRTSILVAKITAGMVCLAVLWSSMVICSVIATQGLGGDEFHRDLGNYMTALAVVQLTFFSLGIALSASMKNSKIPSKVIALVVFASYFIYALVKMTPLLDWLQYLSIFSYFDAVRIIHDGSLDNYFMMVCMVVVLVCLATAVQRYTRRDLRV